MYTLIENFCLGLRRLEIFGRPYSLRPGWVTCGDFELTPDLIDETGARDYDQTVLESELPRDGLGRAVVPMSQGPYICLSFPSLSPCLPVCSQKSISFDQSRPTDPVMQARAAKAVRSGAYRLSSPEGNKHPTWRWLAVGCHPDR